jgi:hypothetical protein
MIHSTPSSGADWGLNAYLTRPRETDDDYSQENKLDTPQKAVISDFPRHIESGARTT